MRRVQDVTERRRSEEYRQPAVGTRARVKGGDTGSLDGVDRSRNKPAALGIITNASTGLRMLDAEPPNVEGARGTRGVRYATARSL